MVCSPYRTLDEILKLEKLIGADVSRWDGHSNHNHAQVAAALRSGGIGVSSPPTRPSPRDTHAAHVTQADVDAFEYSPQYISPEILARVEFAVHRRVVLPMDFVRDVCLLERILHFEREVERKQP